MNDKIILMLVELTNLQRDRLTTAITKLETTKLDLSLFRVSASVLQREEVDKMTKSLTNLQNDLQKIKDDLNINYPYEKGEKYGSNIC